MKMKRYIDIEALGVDLGLSQDQILIVKMKTKLKKKIITESNKLDISNTELRPGLLFDFDKKGEIIS